MKDTYNTEFNKIKTDFNTWFALAQSDIALLQVFNMDNQSSYPNTVKSTRFDSFSNSITEDLNFISTNNLIAKRVTVFTSPTVITEFLTTYFPDGTTIKSNIKKTITFNVNGTVSEEVVLV